MRIPCSGHTVLNADGNVKTRWIFWIHSLILHQLLFSRKKRTQNSYSCNAMRQSLDEIIWFWNLWFDWSLILVYYEGSLNGLIVRLVEPVISQVSSSPSCWGAQSRAGQLLLSPEYCGDWRMMPDWLQSLKSYTSWLYLILYIWDVGKWDFHEIRVSRKMLE